MAVNDNRRRKKIEAKRAKKKDKQRSIARFESGGLAAKLASANSWPVVDSLISSEWENSGMCSVFISRRGPHGQLAGGMFAVDVKCLGVKDAMAYFGTEGEWSLKLRERRERLELKRESPEFLRKLVEGSVQYARKFGFEPHPDYARAAPIFGDIDAASCTTEITYGENGKPHYMNGPFENSQRIRRILQLLEQNAGPGNFNFTVMDGPMNDLLEGVDDSEFEDDFDDDDDESLGDVPRSIEHNP